MTQFDPTKPVQTRDGRKARIICTDFEYAQQSNTLDHLKRTIFALIFDEDIMKEVGCSYLANGTQCSGQLAGYLDLINIPEVTFPCLRRSGPKGSTIFLCTGRLSGIVVEAHDEINLGYCASEKSFMPFIWEDTVPYDGIVELKL